MKIHNLEISAFGPFAGTERIDFDRLSAHGLFLLNGATGAGKTSVLDAICFALYGSVPGSRQDGKRLRSDHSDAASEPRVTCQFSARGRHFEVSRSPAWDKPSVRGKKGFTVQQASTLLRERVAGQWIEKSSRNDEAGAEITALLGMDREQFTRVVMLPQGDFAAFLRAKATDRLELLQKLFGTQRFEAVEQELARQAADAREDVVSQTGRLELLLTHAEAETAALGLDMSEAPAAGDSPEHPRNHFHVDRGLDLLVWFIQGAEEKAETHRNSAEAAELFSAERAHALEEGAARSARQSKLAAAERRRSAALSLAPALEESRAKLELHRKAEVLRGRLEAVRAAEEKEQRAAASMQAAFAELEDMPFEGINLEKDGVGVDVAACLERLRSLSAVLIERLPDERRCAALAARAVELRGTRDGLEADSRSSSEALTSLRIEYDALMAGVRALEELAGEVRQRTTEASVAEELVSVVGRYASAVSLSAQVGERRREARDHHQALRQRWLDLREKRLANAAAELALLLVPGDPCPVCGSPEHPVPAGAGQSALTVAEAEQTAQQSCDAAEKALRAIDRELSLAEQEVAVLAAQGGETDPQAAREEAREARGRAAEAVRAAEDLARSRDRLEELGAQISTTQQVLTSAASGMAEAASALAEVQDQTDELTAALDKLRGGYGDINDRVAAVRDAIGVLERARASEAEVERAASRTAEATEQLEKDLPASGFSSAEEAWSALLSLEDARSLEGVIRSGHDEAARIDELFASEDLLLAIREIEEHGTFRPEDLEQLRGQAVVAEQVARDSLLASALAAKALHALRRMAGEYKELAEAVRQPRERAELLVSLAEAARGGGDNSYRMSLNSYVLAARLEQVAVAASERLVGMSDGRYTLQHTDAKAARGAKSGLGLEVVDQWTGQHRDTATLSGGESFMASLALALGLADVVQQEAGGIDIETLFVDEGFGSLDEQALEQVMDVLEGLRDGGRVVGLVSHVAEMKQRINTQLQVLKGRNGSTLRIADAAADMEAA